MKKVRLMVNMIILIKIHDIKMFSIIMMIHYDDNVIDYAMNRIFHYKS